ncbi:MAG: SHOCT domain-containing protein [Rhodospirillales bacterium]|nr:SHOCT domain-containing protein [Rhodospirillales bacterium]
MGAGKEGYGGYGHMMGGGWGGWGHWIAGPVMMILVIVAIVATIVLVVRWMGGGVSQGPAGKTPGDILKERFARGEIDTKEFEERRKALGE